MKQRVIAVVGMPGAGKGTCTDYLAATYGWPVAHFGNMVYEEVQRRGLDNVRDEKAVREDMRAKDGPAVLAKHIARKAKQFIKDGASVVVLDGLYSWSEYKHLSKVFGDALTIIAVVAPKKLRRERVLNRKDGHRKYTLDELIARENAEIENLEKGGPIAYADYYIINDGAPQHMLTQLEAILAQAGTVAS